MKVIGEIQLIFATRSSLSLQILGETPPKLGDEQANACDSCGNFCTTLGTRKVLLTLDPAQFNSILRLLKLEIRANSC